MAQSQEYGDESSYEKTKCPKVTPKQHWTHVCLHQSRSRWIKVNPWINTRQLCTLQVQRLGALRHPQALFITDILRCNNNHQRPKARSLVDNVRQICSFHICPKLGQTGWIKLCYRTLVLRRSDHSCVVACPYSGIWAELVPLFVQAWEYQLFLSAVSASCCPISMRQRSSKIKTCQRKNCVTEISSAVMP